MQPVFDDRRYLIPFRATLLPQILTDVLVIGAGVAGMRAALAAAEGGADVILAAKGTLNDSNTYWAQGGIAAVLSESDSVAGHVDDTLKAGAGLCDVPVVRRVVEDGPSRSCDLIEWGMAFDRHEPTGLDPGQLCLGREGAHNHARIVHADGDATGRALVGTLSARLHGDKSIRRFDQCFVLDLITQDSNPSQCLGAVTHHPKYGLQVIWAHATVLASGGVGQIYRESTNPPVATGDGLAMAYRAGADLADLAFMQFHPTTLYIAGASRSLITEAVRGEGGQLIDRLGHRFMPDYDDRAELAPRDIVSRSMLKQMVKTGHTNVFLDVRHMGKDFLQKRFPGIYKLLGRFDINPATQLIPVHPSAHYMIGGVCTNDRACTNITGLLACGEAACTGLHGANRLASNSLLEGLVEGRTAGETARQLANEFSGNSPRPVQIISNIRQSDRSRLDLADVRSSLRSVMWRHVGIERDGQRLHEVQEMFEFWARYTMDKIFDKRTGWEVQNLLTVGAMVTQSACWRQESRGTHFRMDYPEMDEALRIHDLWRRGATSPQTLPSLATR